MRTQILDRRRLLERILLLLIILLAISISGCQKDSVIANAGISGTKASTSAKILDAVSCHSLHLGYFSQNKDDHTFDFTPYLFVFCPDHTVSALSDKNTVTGTWSTDEKQTVMNLNFNDPGNGVPFTLLNGDWQITANDYQTLGLERHLTFDESYLRFDLIMR